MFTWCSMFWSSSSGRNSNWQTIKLSLTCLNQDDRNEIFIQRCCSASCTTESGDNAVVDDDDNESENEAYNCVIPEAHNHEANVLACKMGRLALGKIVDEDWRGWQTPESDIRTVDYSGVSEGGECVAIWERLQWVESNQKASSGCGPTGDNVNASLNVAIFILCQINLTNTIGLHSTPRRRAHHTNGHLLSI